ncbi:MAG TPA: ABC transporter ATP-binding protein [bacterium]|nr:ABC transporter ATP-binding protein [bacterium]
MLDAAFSKALGAFELTVEMTAEAGQTLVLVGESGAGKSTILNVLAGLVHPDRGTIRLDATRYFSSEDGIAVPPESRDIGYVFQDYALFPHLSVFENAAFGLRAQGRHPAEVSRRVDGILRQLGVQDLAGRRPSSLSGGQLQRIALARALVLTPRVLLLDEPMSALDLGTRSVVRGELRRVLAALRCITILVTHHPLDAVVFGDRIAVVEGGKFAQVGTREELLRRPRSRYVADLMGLNFFSGRIARREPPGLVEIETGDGTLRIVDPGGEDEIFVAVDPREITLHSGPPAGTAQNVFRGRILELVPEPPLGERIRAVLATRPRLVAEITAHAVRTLGLREGTEVYASFKATAAKGYR